MSISSYGDQAVIDGAVRLIMDLRKPIIGQHVIVVEDIVDSGQTMNYLYQTLKGRNPASLKTCTLFRKDRNSLEVFRLIMWVLIFRMSGWLVMVWIMPIPTAPYPILLS